MPSSVLGAKNIRVKKDSHSWKGHEGDSWVQKMFSIIMVCILIWVPVI